MKCPKCGYNSFESYDVCIKCSHDLTAHKTTYGLKPIVLQMETRAAMAAELAAKSGPSTASEPIPEQSADLFSFDLPDEEPATPAGIESVKEDFFNFDENTVTPPSELLSAFSFDDDQSADKKKSGEDAFSNLLEPTQNGDTVSDDASRTTTTPLTSESSPDEYELNNFSWDDTPETTSDDNKKPVDAFKSLFGEIEDIVKK